MQPPRDLTRAGTPAALALAGLLAVAGTFHFARPEPFASIVPAALGDPVPWVYLSGAVELACAAGLAVRRTRQPTAWVVAGLFVALFPANLQMALDAGDRSTTYRALAYARLPLQLPLIAWAVAVARGARRLS